MKNHPRTSFTGPELCSFDAVQIIELLRKKEMSPEELLDASFERIKQVEPYINAIPTLCEKRARESANNWQQKGRGRPDDRGWARRPTSRYQRPHSSSRCQDNIRYRGTLRFCAKRK